MKLKDTKPLFDALADGTRLRILSLLAERELCVCDIISVLREPQSKVSRHLAYLRRARLVGTRKEGLWAYYRITAPQVGLRGEVLQALKRGRSEVAELANDLREFRSQKGRLVACCR